MPLRRTLRRILRVFLITVFVVAVAVLLLEGLLRLAGKQPWPDSGSMGETSILEPHETRGWTNKPGVHRLPPFAPAGKETVVTILPWGGRPASPGRSAAGDVVVVGGSFTLGWGVSDYETFPRLLAEKLPGERVVNLAVGGYGTLQSLMVLEQWFSRHPDAAELVVYGFTDFHENRNTATPAWRRSLAVNSPSRAVRVPFARMEDGRLQRKPLSVHPDWPFKRHFALVALLEDLYLRAVEAEALDQRVPVTKALLLDMRDLCAEHGAELLVAVIHASTEKKRLYQSFLKEHGVASTDCTLPGTYPKPEYSVPGDGRPNGRMHALWADCLSKPAADLLDRDSE